MATTVCWKAALRAAIAGAHCQMDRGRTLLSQRRHDDDEKAQKGGLLRESICVQGQSTFLRSVRTADGRDAATGKKGGAGSAQQQGMSNPWAALGSSGSDSEDGSD
eukprot:COSAG06_NODE_5667_length_3333_cov_2.441868_1_plen_105_part_10